MGLDELSRSLAQIPGVWIRLEEPMSRHLPLRVGGPADAWAVVSDEDALDAVLRATRQESISWRVHWPLSDLLVRDGPLRGLVIRPGRGFERIRLAEDHVVMGSATPFAALCCLGDGWWAPLADWPGTIGGLLSSADRAWLAGSCARLTWLRGRSRETVELEPGAAPPEVPESAVLTEVALRPGLRLPRRSARRRPPPLGTLFGDPVVHGHPLHAGAELVRAELAGTRLRQWRVSSVEPGTVVQLGGGTIDDLLLLTKGIQERVEKKCASALEIRIPLLGQAPTRRGNR